MRSSIVLIAYQLIVSLAFYDRILLSSISYFTSKPYNVAKKIEIYDDISANLLNSNMKNLYFLFQILIDLFSIGESQRIAE